MEEPEEAAAEAEAERGAGFHLEGEARVVEAELAHRLAQHVEVGGVDREEAAEHHRLRRAEAGQRGGGGLAVVGDGVADIGVRDFLDRGGEEADLAGAELADVDELWGEDADAVELVGSRSAFIIRIFWPFLMVPSMTRMRTTTPR